MQNHFNKMKKEVGMLLQKSTDTRGVGISSMRKSIYLLKTTPSSHWKCTPHFKQSTDWKCTPHFKQSTDWKCTPHFKQSTDWKCTPHFKQSTDWKCTPHFKQSKDWKCTPHFKQSTDWKCTPNFKQSTDWKCNPHFKQPMDWKCLHRLIYNHEHGNTTCINHFISSLRGNQYTLEEVFDCP